jgi:hypothetical protein
MASQGQMSGNQRDDLVRLRWVERKLKEMARRWRDACEESGESAEDQAHAEGLTGCALAVEEMLAGSQAAGGPPADHLADAVLHLRAFTAAARAAGTPASGRLADAIRFIEAADANGGHDVFADIRQAGEAIAAVRAAAARHLGSSSGPGSRNS